ncbi:GNAT family N-acetyltransferase [Pseudodesulfovibrio cashew]|uniref:GNAT family N-acetyltransferase n=1 Tax=Pseudodesulfovibrio cashew TaxID=2678688 RepID=UPI00131A81E5|nr:GNAT family N-acetyltransferase [Pseudodesulfovibrio cashew]
MQYQVEVIDDWSDSPALQGDWDRLAEAKGFWFPFVSYQWFDCWYPAFCVEGNARIVVIRRDGDVVGIVPGVMGRRRIGPITVNEFSYAANGLTPYVSFLFEDDLYGDAKLLLQIDEALSGEIELLNVPAIETTGQDWRFISRGQEGFTNVYEEHRFPSLYVGMPDGFPAFLSGCSTSFRKSFNCTKRKANKQYEVATEEVRLTNQSALHRLQRLSAKTWQEQNGSGLFSEKYRDFFMKLFGKSSTDFSVSFLKFGESDVAFNCFYIRDNTFVGYKIGYDPSFAKLRPGELLKYEIYPFACEHGVTLFHLLGEANESKRHWATGSNDFVNSWLFSKRHLKSLLLEKGLRARKTIKERMEG